MFTLQNIVIYLIIAIVILLIVKFFFCDEYFTEVSANNVSDITKFVGFSKNLNLSVTLNGKEYLIIPVEKSFCGISDTNPKDCLGSVLILKEKSQHDEDIKINKIKMENDEKVCNTREKLNCETNIKAPMITSEITAEMESKLTEEIQQTCKDSYDACKKKFTDSSHFSIIKVEHFIPESKNQLYKIIGKVSTSDGFKEGSLGTAGPNTQLELICFSNSIEGNNYSNSIELEEVISQDNKSNEPSYRIKFLLPDRFNNGLIVYDNGIPVYKSYYVGICAGDKEIKCTSDKDYFRLCLYNSIENPNVLKVTPKLVSK